MNVRLRDARVMVGGIEITTGAFGDDDAFTIDVQVIEGRYLGYRYRGPQCRWCRADDYRKHDGRCPRCGDHKDRGRTDWTMRPAHWTEWDMSGVQDMVAASDYAIGHPPTWVIVLD